MRVYPNEITWIDKENIDGSLSKERNGEVSLELSRSPFDDFEDEEKVAIEITKDDAPAIIMFLEEAFKDS